ncbi:MAG: hypothetical protein HY774_26975 [Acidobacteria bacterium]|nr:hypothetical protein [Acidobacteriota bacterium]
MLKIKLASLGLFIICFCHCSAPPPPASPPPPPAKPVSPVPPVAQSVPAKPAQPVDYKKLILGTWEGVFDGKVEISVTFQKNNTAIVDYSMGSFGGKKSEPLAYSFKDDRTIILKNYPENLVIHSNGPDELVFEPEIVRQDKALIYICVYKRKN